MRIQEERYNTITVKEKVSTQEVIWMGEAPAYMVLQGPPATGGPHIGSPGNMFWIDNVELIYQYGRSKDKSSA